MKFYFRLLLGTYIFAGILKIESFALSDIQIVEITQEDAGVKLATLEDYRANVQSFRKVIATFLRQAQKDAQYIVIDIYFPKYFENEIDDALIRELKDSKRTSLATGHDAKHEYTHQKFRESVMEPGHINVYYLDDQAFEFWPFTCRGEELGPASRATCPVGRIEKHLALIAAITVRQDLGEIRAASRLAAI